MTETSSVGLPRQAENSTSRPQSILDKYIRNQATLHGLISPGGIKSCIGTEAEREVRALSPTETEQMVVDLFSVIGSESPLNETSIGQDMRDGSLELLKLVDPGKIDSQNLISTYLGQVNRTPPDADAFGSVYSLLQAGKIIASHLPERRYSIGLLINAWNQVIANCLVNIPIQNKGATYLELRGVLNEVIEILPNPPVNSLTSYAKSDVVAEPAASRNPTAKMLPKRTQTKKDPEREEDSSGRIFKEIQRNARECEFTPEELPWLKEKVVVSLDRATMLNGNIGVYLGMCIARGEPANVAKRMTTRQRRLAFNTFYTVLPEFIAQHTSGKIKTLSDQRSAARILYSTNPGGQRLYFMEAGKINNEPVIIVIGMCDKAQQIPLLKAFTNYSFKDLKKVGKI